MWCYQKPGFESLLLSELQRQQQRSQFCDIMLKAEGVAVPAHSCVLSAISPHVSSALSSAPVPTAGWCHLLEFRTLGACTLRHMVELLYSGEMAGEGEEEKQDAISAAAKLGIHGLVEVTRRDGRGGGGRQMEVGSQTEPLMREDNEGRRDRWRREVRSGDTLLWKETVCTSGRDMWTQTEELQVNTAPSAESASSTQTIDTSVLQIIGETEYQIVSSQIPCIPIPLLYGPENQISSAPAEAMQDSTATGHTSGADATMLYTSVALPPCPFSTVCVTPQGAASESTEAEEWQDEEFQQFQGNIPGFINYFLNPDTDSSSRRGRPRGRPRKTTGNTRRAGTGERRAGRPQGSRGGRGGGKLTQTVSVQHVGVSKVQKMYLKRWGRRSTSTGQGGGAVGRKLFLKSRELLKSRRRGDKVWELILPKVEQRTRIQHIKQRGLPGSGTLRAKSTTSYSTSPAPCHIFSSPHLQPSPSSSYMSPAGSLLHTTTLPPPDPPPQEEQPEQIERLLEEVMMGLDILSNANSVPSCTYVLPHNNQQVSTTGSLGEGPCCDGSAVEANTPISAGCAVALLQQQGEGELNDVLDHFLQSFEHHIENSLFREEVEMSGVHEPTCPLVRQDEDAGTTRSSQPCKASAGSLIRPPYAEERSTKVEAQSKVCRRGTSQHFQSLEKEPVSESTAVTLPDHRDKRLLRIPVVKLERRDLKLQEPSAQVKSSAKGKCSSSEHHCSDSSKKIGPDLPRKDYPIRNRLREASKLNAATSRNLRPKGNGQNLSSPNADTFAICRETEKCKEESQEKTTTGTRKRSAKSKVETSDDATAAKRVNIDQQQVSQSCAHTSECVELVSEPADTRAEEMIDVETLSPNDRGAHLEREEFDVREAEERLTDEEVESSGDEIINVDGDTRPDPEKDSDGCGGLEERGKSESFESRSEKTDIVGSTGSSDDDIDVVRGASPPPEPVIIRWTESSGDEEEEVIDVVGDYATSAIFTVHGANFGHDPASALQREIAVDHHTAAHERLLLKKTGELLG